MYFLSIDYDEGMKNSYRGVVISIKTKEIQRWNSGDPVVDWKDMHNWVAAMIKDSGYFPMMETSSVQHFVFDTEYRFDENDMLVKEG